MAHSPIGKAIPNVEYDDFRQVIGAIKTEAVKKSEVLEVMSSENMDNVGGLENLKEWVAKRRACFSQEAREYGIDTVKGILMAGPPGCVAGDTVIGYNRGQRNSSRRISAQELYRKFNGQKASPPPWDLSLPTRIHSWDSETGKVFYNEVRGVFYKGRKKCVRIATDTTGGITLTHDHPVLCEGNAFVPADALRLGDRLLVRGTMRPRRKNDYSRWITKPRIVIEGLNYYEGGWSKTVLDPKGLTYAYRRQHRARLVVEAGMNGVSYDEYVYALKFTPDHPYTLTLPRELEVHHLDENPQNDAPENLQVLPSNEHNALHREQSIANLSVDYTAKARVVRIGEAGYREVYDILMAEPFVNFAVNQGIIVSSCCV
ncbi:MAG: HNH endonuclease [Alphaproteobacteria bacterium]|nr:HNH endonuclease [Alphaproteobacteria bacterium]